MLINLNTFALNAKVIILNEKDINNSINLTVPYHSFSTVSELAKEYDIEQIIIQGNKKFAENYLDGLKENYNNKKYVEITINEIIFYKWYGKGD